MASTLVDGHRTWSLTRDKEGQRDYQIVHRVRASKTDGPFTILNTAGLPQVGSIWQVDNDLDAWAFCWPTARVSPVITNEPNLYWDVQQTFSTKPLSRCQDETVEDPLLEPQKMSGSFTREKTVPDQPIYDKDGVIIESSSHEPVKGLSFDIGNPTVNISQNVATLELPLLTEMMNTLNDAEMWGVAARNIKLSSISWERKLYGTCSYYFTRNFGFEVNFDSFDVTIEDEGHKVVENGDDPAILTNFVIAKDKKEDNLDTVLLNGAGARSATRAEATANEITVQFYRESNFLLLGIPTIIGP